GPGVHGRRARYNRHGCGAGRPRNLGTPGPRNLGTCEPRNPGTREPRNLGTPEPRNLGTPEPRNLDVIHHRIWEDVPADAARVAATAEILKVPPVIARLLCQRGVDDPDAARRFLSPSLAHLHDPFLLSGMREAVDRLL